MQVDAIETGSHYQLAIALPGVRKGELPRMLLTHPACTC
jgi:HSP20 family molecular chaperone IbpA